MLKIRRPQIDALATLSRRRFLAGAAVHLREVHPERWADVGEPEVAAWVERRVDRGVELGLIEELSLLRHLEVASRFDERFADSDDALSVLHDVEALHTWPEPLHQLEALHESRGET